MPAPVLYTKIGFVDNDTNYPLSAARLNVLDQAVLDGQIPPSVVVVNSANISIPDSAHTSVTFDLENYDPYGMHSTVSNTSRLVAVTAGTYAVWMTAVWAASSTGFRQLGLWKNGTIVHSQSRSPAVPSPDASVTNHSPIIRLAVNDYIEMKAYQNSGAALMITTSGGSSPIFAMALLAY